MKLLGIRLVPRRKRTLTIHFHGCNRFWRCRLRYPAPRSSFQHETQPWLFLLDPSAHSFISLYGLQGRSLRARFRYPLATKEAGSQEPHSLRACQRDLVCFQAKAFSFWRDPRMEMHFDLLCICPLLHRLTCSCNFFLTPVAKMGCVCMPE